MNQIIKIHEREGYAVMELEGRFVPGGDPDIADVLKQKFVELVAKGFIKVLVDLRNVDFFASNSIGAMMSGYNTIATANGKMVFWRPKKYLADSLRLVRIDKIVSIIDNEQEALSAIGIKIDM